MSQNKNRTTQTQEPIHNQTSHNSHNNLETNITGTVLRISGTIIDIQFPQGATPAIFNKLVISIPQEDSPSQTNQVALEVAQQLGDGIVRCIALEDISNISRGLLVQDTGEPIRVPVGKVVLGRVFDVLGNTIDSKTALPEQV